MMVPRSRLLWWVGLVGIPLGAVATAVPEAALVGGAVFATLLLVAALDAALAWGTLDGVGVHTAESVRLSDGLDGALTLELDHDRPRPRRLRVGLVAPEPLALEAEELFVELAPQGERVELTWPCRPVRRGRYPISECVLEESSPLGFWDHRRTVTLATEASVYPSLLRERKNLAALFLNRGPFGIHAHRQVGRGREFEKLREYVPGDPTEDIDWKATARRHRPITRVYQIERTQEVYVAIDVSRLSGRPATDAPALRPNAATAVPTMLDRFITAALVMELAAERQGDRFGLLSFGDRVGRFVRAEPGAAQHRTCREALSTLEVGVVSPDFEELCSFLRQRLRRRSLIVILTSLDDPVLAADFQRAIKLVARKHLVLVNMLRPASAQPLFADGEVSQTDDIYHKLGGHLQWNDLRQLETALRRSGVRLHQLNDAALAAEVVDEYMAVKRRQLL